MLLRAVRKHTKCAWVILYIERWLKVPAMSDDGMLVEREQGTPQGGVISPLLANLFLHYVFDIWLGRGFPGVPFERYADDIICHCRSERQAVALRATLERRFAECGLALHPEKTKVVYCKDTNRKGDYPTIQFDFLGYTFRPRLAMWRGGSYGVSFLPAASPKALKAIRRVIRGWSFQTRSDKALDDLARMFNPYIRGWINYYSHFYKSVLYPTLLRIDAHLLRWAQRKFKRFRQRPRGARSWLARVTRSSPGLFAHWPLVHGNGRMLGAV
jgi:group II intron reverse transcriptase/maturase